MMMLSVILVVSLMVRGSTAVPSFMRLERQPMHARKSTVADQAQQVQPSPSTNQDCSQKTTAHITFGLAQITRAAFESQLRRKDISKHNIVISPLTIYNSLYLLYKGAVGRTAAHFKYALALPQIFNERNAFDQWQTCLFSQSTAGTLSNVNAVFVDDSLELDNEYSLYVNNSMSNSFAKSASIRNAIRSGKINELVAASTDGEVAGLFDEPDVWLQWMCISRMRRWSFFKAENHPCNDFTSAQLLIVAALQFDALWALPFHRQDPQQAFRAPDEVKQVDMMTVTARMRYFHSQAFGEFVELPYGGNNGSSDFALYLHLARFSDYQLISIPHRMRYFYELICRQMDQFSPWNLELHVPRFELQPHPIDLEDSVRGLGLRILYEKPDLSGIVSDGAVKMMKMIHKTSFTVAEKGTRVSSGTSANIRAPSNPAHQLRFNRPFYAIVLHRPSNTPILTAYVQDPTLDPVSSITPSTPPLHEDVQTSLPVLEDEVVSTMTEVSELDSTEIQTDTTTAKVPSEVPEVATTPEESTDAPLELLPSTPAVPIQTNVETVITLDYDLMQEQDASDGALKLCFKWQKRKLRKIKRHLDWQRKKRIDSDIRRRRVVKRHGRSPKVYRMALSNSCTLRVIIPSM